MRIQRSLLAVSLLILFIAGGCDQSFDPRGPYQKRLVVYSILSNRSDSQYVRVYTTYNPDGFDPLENASDTYVRNAQVAMTDDSTSYALQETTIYRDDKSRYATDVIAYLSYPRPVRIGRTYSLTVRSDQGNATAMVRVPSKGYVFNNTPYIFNDPNRYTEDIPVSLGLSNVTQGYLVRLYFEFDIQAGQSLVRKRLEVPTSVMVTGINSKQYVYPKLTRHPSATSFQFTVVFPRTGYVALYTDLMDQYGGFTPRSAIFILTQVEANLFNYYNIVNGFQDPYSVREDQPDYSNIVGGVGVFGAMTEDSLVVDLQNH
jgi:hypothetical protein